MHKDFHTSACMQANTSARNMKRPRVFELISHAMYIRYDFLMDPPLYGTEGLKYVNSSCSLKF